MRPIRIPIIGVDLTKRSFNRAMGNINKFASSAKKVGGALTMGVTLPLVAAGIATVNASNNINSGMANVGTLIPENTGRVLKLKKNVQDLAIETGKATDDITGGLYQVISAFGDASDTSEKLRINVRAARAGLATTTDAINLTSAVTKAYGDTSADAVQRVADLSFHTVKLGQTSFPELAGSIGRVAPLAQTLNVSMEEMFGVLATTTGVVGNTAEASTQLSSILTALIKPSTKMQQLFNHLGYGSGKAMIAELGFAKSLEIIMDMSKKANVPLGELLGRKEAMISTLSLTGAQAETFATKLGLIRNSSGKLDEAFKVQTEGINKAGFTFDRFKQKVTVLAQNFGDILAPAIGGIMEFLNPVIDAFTGLPSTVKRTMALIGISAGALGPIILVAGALAAAVTTLASTVGLIIAAAVWYGAQVALAAVLVIRNWGKIKGFFTNLWDFLTKLFRSRIGKLIIFMNPFTSMVALIIKNWGKLSGFFKSLFGKIKDIFSSFVNIIKTFEPPAWLTKIIDNPVGRWLLGNSEGTAFFSDSAQPSGPPAGAEAVTRQAAAIHNSTVSKKESTVKVEFANAPSGTRVSQDDGPSMDPNMGFAMVSP